MNECKTTLAASEMCSGWIRFSMLDAVCLLSLHAIVINGVVDRMSNLPVELHIAYPSIIGPPFDNQQPNGQYMPPGGIDGTDLQAEDVHGQGLKLGAKRASATETCHQYFWFELSDGFNYWDTIEHGYGEGIWGESASWAGDPRGRQGYADRTIEYKVYQDGPASWKYEINKAGDAAPVVITIPNSGAWVAQ